MIKRILLIAAVLFSINTPVHAAFQISFEGLGAGGQASFVLTDWEGPAFGFGVTGMAEFDLGKIGLLQYAPSINFWFKSEKETLPNGDRMKHLDGQIIMNFFDVRYIFPIKKESVKPYAGISVLPAIVVNIDTDKRNGEKFREDSWTNAGFNSFVGIGFPINNKFVPYIEWRFTASNHWAMRASGGFVIRF